jgi:hypothetical protein
MRIRVDYSNLLSFAMRGRLLALIAQARHCEIALPTESRLRRNPI